eukprot:Em0005g14a
MRSAQYGAEVTSLCGPTVSCDLAGTVYSSVQLAAPVVPPVVTYFNETDPLSLMCSKFNCIALFHQPCGCWQLHLCYKAGNGVTSVTGTTLVVVYYPPTVLSPQPTVYMVQGRTIQLNCTFDGLPTPNVIWTHPNGSVITSQSRFTIQTTSTSSSLTITALVGGGDTGTYTCRASNLRGVSTNTVQLFVQVPSDPPSNVMVTSVGNSSLSLSWTNGFDGFSPLSNVVISYEVDRYPQEGTQAQTFPMETSATLVDLHPYSNYTLHVSLTNAVGFISNPTNITVTTLSLRPMAPAITSVVAMSSTQVTIMWTGARCQCPKCCSTDTSRAYEQSSMAHVIRFQSISYSIHGSTTMAAVSLKVHILFPCVWHLKIDLEITTSQPCLYNCTIGNGSPVIVTQSAPVYLICSSTANTNWTIGGVAMAGIPGAPYILYVMSPTTTLSGVTAVCYTPPGTNVFRSTVQLAAPVVPQVVTYVNEGDTSNLICSSGVTFNTLAVALFSPYSWLAPNGTTISTSSTASLSSINRVAAGNYTCPTVYMVQGRTIQLNCTFDGLPAPNVIWTHPNGSVITSQSRFTIQTTSTSSSLTITSLVGGGDNGTYTCRASNFRGVSSNTVQLFVQASTLVVGLKAVVMTTTSVNLIWTPPADNGGQNISQYVIQYGILDGNYLTNVTTTTTMATQILLSGLTENSWYLFSVAAHNDFAVGDSTLQIKVLLGYPIKPASVLPSGSVWCGPLLWVQLPWVLVHCRSRHLAATISGDHLTMKANTVYSLQKRNNASGEIGYTGDQEQDTAMEVNCAYATFRFNENNEIETY